KKISKFRARTVEYDETLAAGSVENQVHETMDKEQREKIVEELLNAVGPEQRACVVLRNIEGLSYQEIAQTLKININTVRSRLKRAREKMMELKGKVDYGRV